MIKEESKDGNKKEGNSMLKKDTIIYEGLWVPKPHRIIMTYEKFHTWKDGWYERFWYILQNSIWHLVTN